MIHRIYNIIRCIQKSYYTSILVNLINLISQKHTPDNQNKNLISKTNATVRQVRQREKSLCKLQKDWIV